MNEQMTFAEFKAWFKGFLEGKDGAALQTDDIERIQMMLDSVVEEQKQTVITQPVVVQPMLPYIAPIIIPSAPQPHPWTPYVPWCGDDTTGSVPPGFVKKYFTTTLSPGDTSNVIASDVQCSNVSSPLH